MTLILLNLSKNMHSSYLTYSCNHKANVFGFTHSLNLPICLVSLTCIQGIDAYLYGIITTILGSVVSDL